MKQASLKHRLLAHHMNTASGTLAPRESPHNRRSRLGYFILVCTVAAASSVATILIFNLFRNALASRGIHQ